MEATAELKSSLWNAFPAYKWNVEFTDKAISKITGDIADWRPPSPDGSWQFSLKEIAAHIVDAAQMFYLQLTGAEEDEKGYFMKWPEDGSTQWTHNSDFTFEDVKAKLVEVRSMWNEVMNWDIAKAHVPTGGTIKQYEEAKKLVAEGKYPESALANGPATPVRVLGSLVAHEAQHRGTLIAYLRSYHGVSFAGKE
jgi:uncharacterized damage-inducible protein DinB